MKGFLVIYLISLGALSHILLQDTVLEESMARGKEVYADFCVACHLTAGEGVEGVFPPLASSDYLQNNREKSIVGVKYGQQGELIVNGVTYNSAMPSMGLDDAEIADVMNYVLHSWGNTTEKMVTKKEVSALQQQ